MKFCTILSILLVVSLRVTATVDVKEYQIILDKQLFGRTRPSRPPAAPPPVSTAPGWYTAYRVTMMTQDETTGVIRVGLQNTRDQSAFLLIEGKDRHQDFKLISADYLRSSAEISYQGSVHRFTLEDGPVVSAVSSGSSTSSSQERVTSSPRRSPRLSRPSSEAPTVQVQRFTPEELKAHLEEQQMDAIRTGKPPLPIPLTPEMDRQLVNEGVLPPQ